MSLIETSPAWIIDLVYLIAGVLFIFGLKDMTHPRTANRGNTTSSIAMLLAVMATVIWFEILDPWVLIAAIIVGSAVGIWLSFAVEMTQMPQLVGLFNGFGGGASAVVAGAELIDKFEVAGTLAGTYGLTIAGAASGLIGGVTFFGSLVGAGKLHGWITDSPVRYTGEQIVKILVLATTVFFGVYLVSQPEWLSEFLVANWVPAYWLLVAAASLLGILLVVPIGGADMPVVISLLNSYSGLAAAGTGFVLENTVLIIAGTLVGFAGFILTIIMCEGMNRSIANVFFGGVGEVQESDMEDIYEGNIQETSPEEVEMMLDTAQRVVIVPGYGMAVAQAQHAVKELMDQLEDHGVEIEFAIHPVAGRMPGHMNVLLAEADVPYDKLKELEEINPTFSQTDVVLTIGSNDVINPVANEDESSPISGMPVLEVWEAQTVIVNKRSLSPGFSGIPNPLFAKDNTQMLFGDGKAMFQELVKVFEAEHG